MSSPILSLTNLCVTAGEKEILTQINMEVLPGEVHVVIGRNGAGKSTLGHVLAGRPNYTITAGKASFFAEALMDMAPEERANKGLFMAFQQPIAIPGLSNINFLKAIIAQHRIANKLAPLTAATSFALIQKEMKLLEIPLSFLSRSVNDDFSGGEKKKNELLQMRLLQPKLIILDETDSGLDVEALQLMTHTIQAMKEQGSSLILITHYPRLLEHIPPDVVHVMQDGKIIATGGSDLATKLLNEGYSALDAIKEIKRDEK